MEVEKALEIAKELMEPFNNVTLDWDNQTKWSISVDEKGGIYRNQIADLEKIVAKHGLEYSIERDTIYFWVEEVVSG